MEREELQINAEQARIFARTVYCDISAYIQDHREEYQAFLLEEAEDSNEKNTTAHRPKGGNCQADQ